MNPAISISKLSKSFGPDAPALHEVDLCVDPGEMVGLIGSSGAGKSTLLRHLPGLITATPAGSDDLGRVEILGQPVQSGGRLAPGLREIRSRTGMIFQQFNLVGRLTVLTNVLVGAVYRLPLHCSLTGWFPPEEVEGAMEALKRVGLESMAFRRASTLSGGQQQRAAIARALVQRASVILADEPIASLDPASSRRVMKTLQSINQSDGTTMVITLHQVEVAREFCERIVAMAGGKVVYDGPGTELSEDVQQRVYEQNAHEAESA